MGLLWIVYWLAIAVSFLLGLYCIIKKHIISGSLQTVITIIFTYLSIQIGINSGYSGKGQSEFSYFLDRLFSIQPDALLLVILLIFMIGFNIYHIALLQDDKTSKK